MTTTYQDVDNTSKNESFQGMCYVAEWNVAQSVLAENPPASAERINWANRVIRQTLQASKVTTAMLIMRNADVLANGVNSTDEQMVQGVLGSLDELVELG